MVSYDNPKVNGYDTKFYRALRKHGKSNFKFEVIEIAEDVSDLDGKEIHWIKHYDSYKNGYNSSLGGQIYDTKYEEHPMSKVTNDQVLEIKKLLGDSKKSQYEIASDYGLTQSQVSHINSGKRWMGLGDYSYPIRAAQARLSGEHHPKAVFTEQDVYEIRNRYVNETGRDRKSVV